MKEWGGHELQHSKEPDKKRFPSRKIPGVFFPGGQTQYSTTHKNVAFIDVEKCWDVCMSYFNILRRNKNNIEWGILSSSIIFVRLRRNHFSVEKNNFWEMEITRRSMGDGVCFIRIE